MSKTEIMQASSAQHEGENFTSGFSYFKGHCEGANLSEKTNINNKKYVNTTGGH